MPSISRGAYFFWFVFFFATAPGTVYPAGGSASTMEGTMHIAKNADPKTMNVSASLHLRAVC